MAVNEEPKPNATDAAVMATLVSQAATGVAVMVEQSSAKLDQVLEAANRIAELASSRASLDRLLGDLREQNQKFTERFHEREVIQPVLLTLIGIADRCREQEIAFTKRAQRSPSIEIARAWFAARDARRADRTDIQNALSNLGVASYRGTNARFDAATQNIAARELTGDADRHGCVAGHLRPGYRRHGVIVRPEMVSVYVFQEPRAPQTEGRPSHDID